MSNPQYSTFFIQRDSKRPPYIPFPDYLMDYDLSMTARVLYAFLLNRAMLSQRNKWTDGLGRVYIIFSEKKMCEVLHKGLSAVKKAVADLERAGLLTRKKNGLGKPNHLYLKIAMQAVGKPTTGQPENRPSDGRKSGPLTAGKPTTKNNIESQFISNLNGEENTPSEYGDFGNIRLTEKQYARLKADYPLDLDSYIRERSCLMEATERTYADHEAAIRSLADEHEKKDTGPPVCSKNYSHKGDDSS